MFTSSTREIPRSGNGPRHVAIIMDGNGRWAKKRFLPRVAGHGRGVESVREITKACAQRGIEFLTLFAFSSENWRRPADEVTVLKQLFRLALEQEAEKLRANGIRLRVVGNIAPFGEDILELVRRAETVTAGGRRLTLTVAANYGGRWDLVQAFNRLALDAPERLGRVEERDIEARLSMSYAPEPDLFIRTGGEKRISNFLLWQLAYTELYFTDTLWPDFNAEALDLAIRSFRQRERRFGRTSEQVAVERAEAAAAEASEPVTRVA
jgi:undecaprenyl diphosphate synthase